jgi:diguanylate cyclase (GGDEF)-like protein
MFRRILNFVVFLVLTVVLFMAGRQLELYDYIFFPMLLFPAYFFYERRDDTALGAMLVFIAGVFVYYLWMMPSWRMAAFGAGLLLFAGLAAFYWMRWERTLREEIQLRNKISEEYEALKRKHESRLESLHHLEKQVAGLLDLFEIARDFGESLSFEKIAEIVQKKVLPEISFERMILWIYAKGKEREGEGGGEDAIFAISAGGIHTGHECVSPADSDLIRSVTETHQLLQDGARWVFPMLTDGQLAACMFVEGAQPDDLAKFEVLSAYLSLQVKKVLLYQTVRELSIRDSLTGLFVRRHFLERFDEELRRCIRFELPLAVLLLDIDHFKRYNDDHGHLAGDATLKQVANILRQSLRKVDIVARYGGEEFVMVIPESHREGAFEVAERIRSHIARHNFKIYNTETRVTVSLGVALYPTDLSEQNPKVFQPGIVQDLIQCADRALYRAKEEGRNRVVLYHDL